ncbi:MAG: glutamine-hydrolyzing GMP synthase [Candidatus Izemoplasmatales bacterium]
MPTTDKIVILDFGSQTVQLIARRIREIGLYSEILPYHTSQATLASDPSIKGIILSGGPDSVLTDDRLDMDELILDLGIPICGICYGMQLIHQKMGGTIARAVHSEYGKTECTIHTASKITANIPSSHTVWMSHGDQVITPAPGFQVFGVTPEAIALSGHLEKNIYTMQFHPEVTQTEFGFTYLSNFVLNICHAVPSWNLDFILEEAIEKIRRTVKTEKVMLALSGGVDSSVLAMLLHRAIGNQLRCFYVNTGLMRKKETESIMATYLKHYHMDIRYIDAEDRFLLALKGLKDPEAKRKAIGSEFIRVFEEMTTTFSDCRFLAQGTIYPDVIESQSLSGPGKTIKSHHNVGGLPQDLKFTLIEPLRQLFKDEVRALGIKLGVPESIVKRHPFPGPGLAIRVIGEVTKERLDTLREADDIFISLLRDANLYDQVAQAFVCLLPVKTVGVMGDERTYQEVIAIRSVDTVDFMSATFSKLPWSFVEKVACQIVNQVRGVNRVVYDVTSKPPGTIEWE